MYQQLSFIDLMKAIIDKIKDRTGIDCVDEVKTNQESPFYYVEIISTEPERSKTMWIDVFTVWVHCIAAPSKSSQGVFQLIQKVQEALTEDITLPEGYELLLQTNTGVQNIKLDETDEKHAVMAYEFKVCYGYKCK